MPRIVHPFRRKARCTRDVRVQRVCTRRAVRCQGAHHDCPACQRVWFATSFARSKTREVRRVRAGASAPAATSPRLRRRRLSRRCH
jgi:hypothetical protein